MNEEREGLDMKMGDTEIPCIEPQNVDTSQLLRLNGWRIHQLSLPKLGHEWENYIWIAFEDVAEALGLVFKRRRSDQNDYDVYLTNPRFFKFVEDKDRPNTYYRRQIRGIPIETWDITKAWDLGRNESQALQYILRAKYKGTEKEDLEKAIKFLQRALEEMEDINSK